MASDLNVMLVASEYEGLVKTGGLADVARALPAALRATGAHTKVLMPYYRQLFKHQPEVLISSMDVELNPREHYGCAVRHYNDHGVDVYLLEHHQFYDRDGIYDDGRWPYEDNPLRFGLLSKAAFALCKALDFVPDILHAHDWQTALVPYYLRKRPPEDTFFSRTRSVFNVHNGAYQGKCHARWLGALGIDPSDFIPEHFEDYGEINLLKGAVVFADHIVAVSPGYRDELMHESTSHGLWQTYQAHASKVSGILNGCDYGLWNPEQDKLITAQFSAKDLSGKQQCKAALQAQAQLIVSPERPLFGLVSRLTDQKGLHYLIPALHEFLAQQAQVVVLGSGDAHFASLLRHLAASHPGQVHFTEGYSETLAHQIEAGSDFFMMPSLFEPCGLNQIYSMRYGTLPIVRNTGGLRDTVVPLAVDNHNAKKATGLSFEAPTIEATRVALEQAYVLYTQHPKVFKQVQKNAMAQRFEWQQAAAQYIQTYRSLLTS